MPSYESWLARRQEDHDDAVQAENDDATTPVGRLVESLHRHVKTTLATVAAGLPSDRAMRDVTGVTASCEAAVLGEVARGGPLTRQGLDVAVHRALAEALDVEETATFLQEYWARAGRRREPIVWTSLADALIAHLMGGAR